MMDKRKEWLKEHGKSDVFELTYGEIQELCHYLGRTCPVVEYLVKREESDEYMLKEFFLRKAA
jgi:hypothetical protein